MIICFSGTGNSLEVARQLGSRLGEEVIMLSAAPRALSGRVIWVFPIYSWGVPPVILAAIRKLELTGGSVHHMVATCGDDCGYADRMFRKAIAARGAETGVTATVIMPNNYVTLPGFNVDTPEVASAKLGAMPERVEEVAAMIESGHAATSVTRGSFPLFKTRVIYPWFVRHAMSPKPFASTSACTGCSLCARTCPMGNIEMEPSSDHKRPAWHDRCAFCLRCYHICPHHAVAYGKATGGKGQYMNPLFRK